MLFDEWVMAKEYRYATQASMNLEGHLLGSDWIYTILPTLISIGSTISGTMYKIKYEEDIL